MSFCSRHRTSRELPRISYADSGRSGARKARKAKDVGPRLGGSLSGITSINHAMRVYASINTWPCPLACLSVDGGPSRPPGNSPNRGSGNSHQCACFLQTPITRESTVSGRCRPKTLMRPSRMERAGPRKLASPLLKGRRVRRNLCTYLRWCVLASVSNQDKA